MQRFVTLLGLVLLALAVSPYAGAPFAGAQESVTIRLATIAPRGSGFSEPYERWSTELAEMTEGRVRLRIFAGGVAGDDRQMVQKLESGQLDAASLSATGLGLLVRDSLVLATPGLIQDYGELDAARNAVAPELERSFHDAGYKILGWGDAGAIRLFSREPVRRPSDLRGMHPWVWPDNPLFVEWLRSIRVQGVPLSPAEVLPALQTRRVDVVPISALAAVALQWSGHLRYMTQQSSGVIVGALVMRRDTYERLPADVRSRIDADAARASARTRAATRRADERAYRGLVERGVRPIDIAAHTGEWQETARVTADRVAGRLYSRALVDRVRQAVAAHAAANP
jgi:TRAP-type transport system periplasmic protein